VIEGMEALIVALKSYHVKVNADMEYEMMFLSWPMILLFLMSLSVMIIGKLLSLFFVIQTIS
jgi:hypothetical protein